MLTYNHEKFIRQALDSILKQKVNFNYEIVIGDDASTDNTQKILKEYYKRHPDRIKLLLRKKNIGVTKNFYTVLKHMRGKYVAYLEGDDYWCDSKKLQKQFDFLENHTGFSGCMHNYTVVNQEGLTIKESGYQCTDYNLQPYTFLNNVCTLKDYEVTMGIPSHASTLMFHNFMLDTTVDYRYFYKVNDMIADQTLFITILSKGDLYRLDDNMSTYRLIENYGKCNISSQLKNINSRAVHYQYQLNLERYCKKYLNLYLDMSKYKKNLYVGAICTWFENKTTENMSVLLKIIKMSDSLVDYVVLLIKVIFIKSYNKRIGKDIRIVI